MKRILMVNEMNKTAPHQSINERYLLETRYVIVRATVGTVNMIAKQRLSVVSCAYL